MATQTTNLNLIKPSGSDKIRIAQINQNMDILDEKIGPVGSSSLQAQMSTVTGYTTMSNGTNLNALTTKANYLVGNISQMLNAPTGAGTSGFFYIENNSSYILQRFWGDQDKAYRFSYNGGSTWNSWVVHKTEIDSINGKLAPEGVTLTPATGVTIVTNRSYKIGKILVLCVKGYTTEAKSNGAKIFDLPATVLQNGIPFPIGIGVEWGITDTGYGYCRSNDIGATLSAGQYFHINATLVFA